jgi:glycosyltransferase involved in cell wall biosynthesis
MQSLSVVVPCYNESENIKLIIQGFINAVGDKKNIEVILVNNGSTDNSSEVFENELNKIHNNFFKIVLVEKNEGYGHGIITGLKNSNGNLLAWTHADMQTDPVDVIKGYEIFQKLNRSNIFIKGKRLKRRPLEALFTWGMQLVAFFALNIYLDDINAQPKIFTRNFFEKYIENSAPKDFSLDLFILFMAKKYHYEIVELPVIFSKRHAGMAKGGGSWRTRIKLIKRTLLYILELRKKINI